MRKTQLKYSYNSLLLESNRVEMKSFSKTFLSAIVILNFRIKIKNNF